jgi:hypothetical protein
MWDLGADFADTLYLIPINVVGFLYSLDNLRAWLFVRNALNVPGSVSNVALRAASTLQVREKAR